MTFLAEFPQLHPILPTLQFFALHYADKIQTSRPAPLVHGSTGFGKAFLHAGDKEWGRNMQHDLTDAVNWAVSEGYADPKRLCIYGGSYGGYAVLAAAAYMRTRADVDPRRVYLVGHSTGGTLVLMAAQLDVVISGRRRVWAETT